MRQRNSILARWGDLALREALLESTTVTPHDLARTPTTTAQPTTVRTTCCGSSSSKVTVAAEGATIAPNLNRPAPADHRGTAVRSIAS